MRVSPEASRVTRAEGSGPFCAGVQARVQAVPGGPALWDHGSAQLAHEYASRARHRSRRGSSALAHHCSALVFASGPVKHLMQQPMMLDNILKLCQKEHPSFSACKTACAKVRGRRGLRALERHRVPFCVYSARPTPVRGAWAAQVGQIVMQVNNSKNAHESQLRLVELQERLRGDFEDLVGPARKLVREASVEEVPTRGLTFAPSPFPRFLAHSPDEWSLHQVARKATRGRANAASDGEGVEVVGRYQSSFARVAGPVHHYAFLCNDSLWFCEVLRGNKYKVVHTFWFAAADTQSSPIQREQDANGRPQATTDVQQSSQFSFWVSDSTFSVHLRLADGEDADLWVQAIEEATGVNARQGDDALETGVVADDAMAPVEEQPGRPAAEEESQVQASQSTSLDATSVPSGLPRPSARYIAQYRARHNLGRSSQGSVSVGGSGKALLSSAV